MAGNFHIAAGKSVPLMRGHAHLTTLFDDNQVIALIPYCAFIKGQLISKCPYEMIVSSKILTKLFLDFCPEIFCSFLGASWKLFGLPGDLVCNIINKEAYKKPQKASKKPPGRYKKFQGRNSEIISLVILSKR